MSRLLSDINKKYLEAKSGPPVNHTILERFKRQLRKFIDFSVLKLPIVVESIPNLGNMICQIEAFQNKCQFLTFVDAVALSRTSIDDMDRISPQQLEVIKSNMLENFAQKATAQREDVFRDFDFEKDKEMFEDLATEYSLKIDVYRGFKGRGLSLLNKTAYVFPILYKSYQSRKSNSINLQPVKIIYYEDLDQFETLDSNSWKYMIDISEDEFNELLFRYFYLNKETYLLKDLEILSYGIRDAEKVYGDSSVEMLLKLFGRFMDHMYETIQKVVDNEDFRARVDDIAESFLYIGDATVHIIGDYKYDWRLVRDNARFPTSTSQLRFNVERVFDEYISDLKFTSKNRKKKEYSVVDDGGEDDDIYADKESEFEDEIYDRQKPRDYERGKRQEYEKKTMSELFGYTPSEKEKEKEKKKGKKEKETINASFTQVRLPDGSLGINTEILDGGKVEKGMPISLFLQRGLEEDREDQEFGQRTLGGARWCSTKGESFYVEIEYVFQNDEDAPFYENQQFKIDTKYDTVGSLIRKISRHIEQSNFRLNGDVKLKDFQLKTEDDSGNTKKYNYTSHANIKMCSIAKKNSKMTVIIPSMYAYTGALPPSPTSSPILGSGRTF